MSQVAEFRVWECKLCNARTPEPALLRAQSPFDPDDTLTGCPECKQCDDGFALLCDEPGCTSEAGCGWPTGDESDVWGGYRNTCYKHMASHP